jgi:MerR family transcriptional regulator, redox-sensitive transcriptional activator SoxR
MRARGEEWSIGELGNRAGLNASAIRYYERLGLLPEAERVGGKRRYDRSALTRLAVIDVAQRAGFTLAETRTLLGGFSRRTPPPQRWRALAQRKLVEVDALIARANGMRRLLQEGIDCDCLSLEQCEPFLANSRAHRTDQTSR